MQGPVGEYVSIALIVLALSVPAGGCAAEATPSPEPRATPQVQPVDANTNAAPTASPVASASPAPQAAVKVVSPPPLHRTRVPAPPIETGWAKIVEHNHPDQRAWVEGEVIGGDQFVINTENVGVFTLDLTRVRLNWSKRIVLRMDGFNSELTRKRWPVLHMMRTASGAWDVLDD